MTFARQKLLEISKSLRKRISRVDHFRSTCPLAPKRPSRGHRDTPYVRATRKTKTRKKREGATDREGGLKRRKWRGGVWDTLDGAVTARILRSILRLPLSSHPCPPFCPSNPPTSPSYVSHSVPDSIERRVVLCGGSPFSGTLRLILCTPAAALPF